MADTQPDQRHFLERVERFFREYAGFIIRNLVGWMLILLSPVLGVAVPGPGGLPVFLIGFALVTFPGKRRLTSRVLRGRRLRLEDKGYFYLAAALSILIPGIALGVLAFQLEQKETLRHLVDTYGPKKGALVLTVLIAILIVWLVSRVSLLLLNWLLRILPKFRRKFRPWMKTWGLKLLPPRRRKSDQVQPEADEILELAPHHARRLKEIWQVAKPWVKRIVTVALLATIFAIMFRPLRDKWPEVRDHIGELSAWRFFVGAVMFAIFLLCFRAFSWRRVLKGFGYKLPYGAAARIWSTSELARYLPGSIWQVVGRVFLCKPYGVPGTIVSTSQILEICVFLFANVLVAGCCLLWFGAKMQAEARPFFIAGMALVPALALLLHPKVFYTIANTLLRRLGKPPITKRLRGRKLIYLLIWVLFGLLWQTLAVYLITSPVLKLKIDWLWVVAGSYCLAWMSGFLMAFAAPAGLGVREFVFVTTMMVILPEDVKARFASPAALKALLVLLGFMLRLWTVAGELLLAGVAIWWDYKGFMNRPGAPGRIATPAEASDVTAEPPTPATTTVPATDPGGPT